MLPCHLMVRNWYQQLVQNAASTKKSAGLKKEKGEKTPVIFPNTTQEKQVISAFQQWLSLDFMGKKSRSKDNNLQLLFSKENMDTPLGRRRNIIGNMKDMQFLFALKKAVSHMGICKDEKAEQHRIRWSNGNLQTWKQNSTEFINMQRDSLA